jgi:hypothetical protein
MFREVDAPEFNSIRTLCAAPTKPRQGEAHFAVLRKLWPQPGRFLPKETLLE